MNESGIIYNIFNPFDKNLKFNTNQDIYVNKCNEAFEEFVKSLFYDINDEMFNEVDKLILRFDISGDKNIINKDDDYEFKFLKSKFINNRYSKIKNILSNYYKEYNALVINIKLDNEFLFITLKKSIYNY